MKLLLIAAAFGLAAPALAGDKPAAPPAQVKKDCRHDAQPCAKAKRTEHARPGSGSFHEANGGIAAAPMAPSLPPPAG